MVRSLYVMAFLLLAVCGYCQEYPSPFQYRMIDSLDLSKDEIFTRARSWVSINFNSAQHVLQMDDRMAGKIVGKGMIESPAYNMIGMAAGSAYVEFTISIDIKDNKYRVQLFDYVQEKGSDIKSPSGGSLNDDKPDGGYMNYNKKTWEKVKETANKQSIAMLASLKEYIHKNEEGF